MGPRRNRADVDFDSQHSGRPEILKGAQKMPVGAIVLDRAPEEIGSARPLAERFLQGLLDAGDLVG